MLHMTEEEYQQFLQRTKGTPQPFPKTTKAAPPGRAKRAKYFNKKVYGYEDGYVSTEKSDKHGKLVEQYDSVKEYQRSRELFILLRTGEITDLELQRSLLIQEAFQSADGIKHQAVTYRADFAYRKDGRQIIEDVKGYDEHRKKYLTTQVFDLKWKLLQAKYPEYTFVLY